MKVQKCPLDKDEFMSYSEFAIHLVEKHRQLALDYLTAFIIGMAMDGNAG